MANENIPPSAVMNAYGSLFCRLDWLLLYGWFSDVVANGRLHVHGGETHGFFEGGSSHFLLHAASLLEEADWRIPCLVLTVFRADIVLNGRKEKTPRPLSCLGQRVALYHVNNTEGVINVSQIGHHG